MKFFGRQVSVGFNMFLLLARYKVSGPDSCNYWVGHEAHGGSDADDA